MHTSARLSCLLALSVLACAASAQSIRPGLWEIEHTTSGNSEVDQAMAQMRQQLANMPPEQRKMMEQMMAAQGVKVAPGSGGMAVQVCITPEMAARQELPVQTQGSCTHKIDSRSGNTMKISYSCTNPPSSGQGTYTFRGDTGYDMDMTVHTQDRNRPTTMNLKGKGRWLAADCGNVKPLGAPFGKN
jgi:hypothetical protein